MPTYDVYFEVTEKKLYRLSVPASDHKEAFIAVDEELVDYRNNPASGLPEKCVSIPNQTEISVEIAYVEPVEEYSDDR